MSAIVVDHEELNSLLFAIGHFPEATPNRWELVSEFVRSNKKVGTPACVTAPTVCLGRSNEAVKKSKFLSLDNRSNCKVIYKLVKISYPLLLERSLVDVLFKKSAKTAFKPIILVPSKTKCCGGRNIKMDSRPSFPIVYTMTGTYVGALFHGECVSCKVRYFPNYKIINGEHRIYDNPLESHNEYFQVTCKSVFDKQLLKDMSSNIWVTGATFQSRAKVYNLNFREKDKERQ